MAMLIQESSSLNTRNGSPLNRMVEMQERVNRIDGLRQSSQGNGQTLRLKAKSALAQIQPDHQSFKSRQKSEISNQLNNYISRRCDTSLLGSVAPKVEAASLDINKVLS